MKNKKYTFGDVTFEVESPFELADKNNCSEFLSEDETDYLIRVIPTDSDDEIRAQVKREGNVISRFIKKKYADAQNIASIFASSDAALLFPKHDAFILHASYIIIGGKAILFTAPSGTGKSTQARFWKDERGAEIVNGDRVLVTRRNGAFYANGIYACGTSGISHNRTAPIEAVVLLEQGEENEINKIPSRKLFLRILCECTYDIKDLEQYVKITELVSDMINSLPTLCYRCKKSPEAVEALEKILWKKE
jgi:hypothetical protein